MWWLLAQRLRHPWRAWGPRCKALPPRKLGADVCCMSRGHAGEWHADGQGYIWNATRWQWQGLPMGPEEYDVARWGHHREPVGGFIEDPPRT